MPETTDADREHLRAPMLFRYYRDKATNALRLTDYTKQPMLSAYGIATMPETIDTNRDHLRPPMLFRYYRDRERLSYAAPMV